MNQKLEAPVISFKEAHQLIEERNALLLDVREDIEFITGHASAAELFTLEDITEETARDMIPSKDYPVILYCRTGRRSKEAGELLLSMGYTEVYDVGGLNGWPYGMVV